MSAVFHAKTKKPKKSAWLCYNGATNEELCTGVTVPMSFKADFVGQRLLCNGAAMETRSVITLT